MLATNKWIAGYRWIRIIQWWITFNFISKSKFLISNYLKWVIPIWVMVEVGLALAQIINGGSLNGIWYWIGERRFSLSTIGIAQMNWWGEGIVRGYGSFSHPNSLSGFLLVVGWYWQKVKKRKNIGYWIIFWMIMLGLLITGSRWIWAIVAGWMIFTLRKKAILFLGLILMVVGIMGENYQFKDWFYGWDKESGIKRWELMVSAGKMIKDHPLLGVGAGNFVVELPQYQTNRGNNWWQPVHNIFGLMLSEIGILGIIAVAFGFFQKKVNWMVMGIVAITGMMDHYWLTLPQNSWLLAVILGIM